MKKIKRKKIILAVLLLMIILAVAAFLIIKDLQEQEKYRYDNSSADPDTYHEITYNGKTYQLNTQLDLVLIIGVDSTGKLIGKAKYGEGGQADTIDLIILDRENKRIKILPISRDTITAVHSFSSEGYQLPAMETHLGFAYTFGDGGKESCLNTCQAVSDLLSGIEIDDYAATNLDSIALPNRLIGGVQVTVPNNDVAHLHPELTEGASVVLTDDNVSDFLRYRNTALDGSNNGRMERNAAFLEGYIAKAKTLSRDDIVKMWDSIQQEEGNILTSLQGERFLTLFTECKEYTYDSSVDLLQIPGNDGELDGYDAFYPDQEALMALVVETFYVEK